MRLLLKEKCAGAATAVTSLFLAVPSATAQIFGEIPETNPGDAGGSLSSIVTSLINGLLMLLGIIAVVIIVIAGLRLVVGGADEGQRQKARDQILWAVVGLIIIVLASAIVRFVEDLIIGT